MKKLLITCALASLATSGAFAQGDIIFENYFGSGNTANAIIHLADGISLPAGSAYKADLLFGTSAGTVNQDAGFAVNFSSGAGAGYFLGGPQTLALSGTLFMEIVAWQTSAGASWAVATGGATSYAQSSTYAANSAGGPWFIGPVFTESVPASPTPGVTFASLISPGNMVPAPEPTTLALGGLGAAALLLFRRRK